ncbi:hypothetical protein F5B18DRAFT_630656 [Nemania serpens]|nr:hypothetical protein F5B18DRAFT_630656 [Nemania serpens]
MRQALTTGSVHQTILLLSFIGALNLSGSSEPVHNVSKTGSKSGENLQQSQVKNITLSSGPLGKGDLIQQVQDDKLFSRNSA